MYPPAKAFDEGHLPVSPLHSIYYQRCGNPEGIPVVFLHGGPGGGIAPSYSQYFNPNKYHVILFDQRGCGRSTPFSELKENTTWDLVSDIEKLREKFQIPSWAVFGGSWGSTLALSYASKYPQNITALFLRGIFLLRKKELHWFYQEGASKIFPDAWDKFLAPIPEPEREDLMSAYHKRLNSEDLSIRNEAAKAWSIWEATTSLLIPNSEKIREAGEDDFADAFARIESHYFVNKGFFEKESYLLDSIPLFRHIPCIIAQGRYDVVCPMESAWELHKAWPESKLEIAADSGHSLAEKSISKILVDATDRFANTGIL